MEIVFKIVDRSDRFVGFIKDPLLNLSKTPDGVIRQSISSKSELNACIKKHQNNLDNLLTKSIQKDNPLAKLTLKVFDNYYSNYKSGDLKVTIAPISKYLY
jgi:hypothetical protein